MKKYFALILIPCLLLQLNGCYNMQLISEDEFLEDPNYYMLNVKTIDKNILFETGNYSLTNDTIWGSGINKKEIDSENVEEPFEGSVGIKDVVEIQAYKFNGTTVAALGIFLVFTFSIFYWNIRDAKHL